MPASRLAASQYCCDEARWQADHRHHHRFLKRVDELCSGVVTEPHCSPATCLSSKATTGWGDWVHGELWLTCRGFGYRRGNLVQTILNYFRRDKRGLQRPCEELFDPTRQDHGDLAVDSRNVRGYDYRGGLLTSRLEVALDDGEVSKFLWLRNRRSSGLARQWINSHG